MGTKLLSLILVVLSILPLQAQTEERYIEVTGTSEIEIVPDKIHYIIEIKEYCKRLSKYIFYSSFSLLTFATKK